MTEDETGWSEKGKSSGKGKRPAREQGESGSESTTPTRPSKRTADTSGDDSSVVRTPASDDAGARKVARAAATAGQRDASLASRLGFPALIALICLLGIGVVFYAWTTREALASPRQNIDHWHAVYGVYDCTTDSYVPSFQSTDDLNGIHSHGDGIIHIHPFFEASSGENAQMFHFLNEMRVSVDTERIVLDNGSELVAGTTCADGSPAAIRILHWDFDFQALGGEPPNEIITEDLGSVKFDNDREVYVIAFAPADQEFSSELNNLPPADRFDTLNNVSSAIEYNPTELVPEVTGEDE
ncbi:MAG: hypothetical protein AAF567_21535 [Actinomycetota bacterium]